MWCGCLVLLTPLFFTETLTREGLLGATLFPRLHVVAVLLDLLDDVLRLHLPLEAPESVFQRLALLNYNFCHAYSPPSLCLGLDQRIPASVTGIHANRLLFTSSIGGYPPSQGLNRLLSQNRSVR